MHTDPTQRFSSRVADYVKYRPSYPPALLDHLAVTGILTPVFGIEPNPDMRAAGEHFLRSFKNFTSLPTSAEATTLPPASIDLLLAGQAFHWFDRTPAKAEFRRILRPPGHTALIWNERRIDTPFLAAYEQLLKEFSPDYCKVDHRQITDALLAETIMITGHNGDTIEDFTLMQRPNLAKLDLT